MLEIIFIIVKITGWIGIIFGLLCIVNPDFILPLLIKSIQWKMRCFGLQGAVSPAANARKVMRVWGIVIALFSGFLVYLFTYFFTIGYVLK